MISYTERYPCAQAEYLQKTGELLQHRVSQAFKELKFKTKICKGQGNGVDLFVYDQEGNLLLVIEMLNWSPRSYLSAPRKTSIIENLSEFTCARLLIYTTMKNEDMLRDLKLYNIDLLKLDFQILPRLFHNYFERQNRVLLREIDSDGTQRHITNRIFRYMQSLNLHLGVLDSEAIVKRDSV